MIRYIGIGATCAVLSACAGPVVEVPEVVVAQEDLPFARPELVPLTVEQALPDGIPSSAVRIQGNCYFYRNGDDLLPLGQTVAPDLGTICAG